MKSLLLALTIVSFSSSLFAMDCPVEFGNEEYLDKVATLATNAPSCYEAAEIVNACALGSSGDVYTVSSAIVRCEKDIPKMSKKDQASYEYLKKRCDDKYSKMQGTMYRSANAFCHLSATQFYNSLLSDEGEL